MQTDEMRFVRRVKGVTRRDRIRNQKFRDMPETPSVFLKLIYKVATVELMETSVKDGGRKTC